jgi:hypothetical protein
MELAGQTKQSADARPAESRDEKPCIGVVEVRVKGKSLSVPSVELEGRRVVTTGRWLKVAAVQDEELVEGDTVSDPESFAAQIKQSGLRADLFTFAQRLPDATAKHKFHIEWENAAAVPITDYSQWWQYRTEHSIRKGVNRAKKVGVKLDVVEFDDQLVEAICRIYNDTPVRQGKAFWHFQKDFQSVKNALATYLERSIFIGAYFEGELIGFMKITFVNSTAAITQILSVRKHFDKRPNNALIAKAIEICAAEKKSHFIYGSFVYFDPESTLTEFKRRSGFESIPLPRYYIALTLKGRIALALGLHRELARQIPLPLLKQLLRLRKAWYARRSKSQEEPASGKD